MRGVLEEILRVSKVVNPRKKLEENPENNKFLNVYLKAKQSML